MDSADADKPAVVKIWDGDPPVCACAVCGWMPQHPELGLLPWSVIEHWLTAHWDGARDGGLDES
jgi:hypothetical protein